jgi:hypothetical protein
MEIGDTVKVVESQSALYQRILHVEPERLQGSLVGRDPDDPCGIVSVVKVDESFEFVALRADLEVVPA